MASAAKAAPTDPPPQWTLHQCDTHYLLGWRGASSGFNSRQPFIHSIHSFLWNRSWAAIPFLRHDHGVLCPANRVSFLQTPISSASCPFLGGLGQKAMCVHDLLLPEFSWLGGRSGRVL